MNEEYDSQKQQFDDYYERKLLPILKQNERVRYRYLSSFWVLIAMGAVFYPCVIYMILNSQGEADEIRNGIVLGISALFMSCLIGPLYFYRKKVKPQIMPQFAAFFGSFGYEFGGKIADDYLKESCLLGEYNKHESDDFFSGNYEGVRISIAEEKLNLCKKDFKNNEVNKRIFSGVCVLLEMNKPFVGKTVVREDKGMLNAFNKVSGLENVKLEDLLFEKYFEVYSDNQIEARYLLTPAFMERMLKLRDLYEGKNIQFSFNKNRLLIIIPTRQDMFEANSFFSSNINKKKIDVAFEEFYTVLSIVKLLKLNQHIGM